MSSQFTAVLDACVLHSFPLTNLLLHLAEAELYRARWTADIHEEWIRSVLERRPDLTRERLEVRRRAMDESIPDCLVTGYQSLVRGIELPDADDRHVVAAAIRARAAVIVTFNLKDFPDAVLSPFDLAAQHPDAFLHDLIDLNPAVIRTRVEMLLGTYRNPPVTRGAFIATLEQLGLPGAAAGLRSLFPQ